MARLPRLYAPAIPQHVVQRGADGRSLFVDEEDYRSFTALFAETVRAQSLALHAYVLLPSQIRFLATPPDAGAIARVMQAIGRRYVPQLNRKTGRRGALWDRRFRSTLVDPADFLIAAMRYVEQEPGRSGAASAPARWRWSSIGHHTGTEQLPFISDHAAYWALSDTPFERQAIYRELVEKDLGPALVARIGESVERGWALGEEGFVASLAGLNRRATPLSRGRPRSVMSPIKLLV